MVPSYKTTTTPVVRFNSPNMLAPSYVSTNTRLATSPSSMSVGKSKEKMKYKKEVKVEKTSGKTGIASWFSKDSDPKNNYKYNVTVKESYKYK